MTPRVGPTQHSTTSRAVGPAMRALTGPAGNATATPSLGEPRRKRGPARAGSFLTWSAGRDSPHRGVAPGAPAVAEQVRQPARDQPEVGRALRVPELWLRPHRVVVRGPRRVPGPGVVEGEPGGRGVVVVPAVVPPAAALPPQTRTVPAWPDPRTSIYKPLCPEEKVQFHICPSCQSSRYGCVVKEKVDGNLQPEHGIACLSAHRIRK